MCKYFHLQASFGDFDPQASFGCSVSVYMKGTLFFALNLSSSGHLSCRFAFYRWMKSQPGSWCHLYRLQGINTSISCCVCGTLKCCFLTNRTRKLLKRCCVSVFFIPFLSISLGCFVTQAPFNWLETESQLSGTGCAHALFSILKAVIICCWSSMIRHPVIHKSMRLFAPVNRGAMYVTALFPCIQQNGTRGCLYKQRQIFFSSVTSVRKKRRRYFDSIWCDMLHVPGQVKWVVRACLFSQPHCVRFCKSN